MLGEQMFQQTPIPVMLKTLDAGMLRSRVIANNIANINTPGYQRVEVNFEDELKKALDKSSVRGVRTNEKHLPIGGMDLSGVNPSAYKPVDPTLPAASITWISTRKWPTWRKRRSNIISRLNSSRDSTTNSTPPFKPRIFNSNNGEGISLCQ